jgi:hypothetical protein
LLKTFWTGPGRWSDRQLADGTIVWTAPTGRTYTTRPASRLFFPDWHVATGDPPEKPTAAATSDRDVMMPTRRRTRAQARASRIKAERAQNEGDAADRSAPF